jgi:DNA (cytosine-5)-methyltransferase 1
MKTTTSELRVAGTCSGVGGIELGFQQAGFETVWANELDAHANKTYVANFGDAHLDTRSIWEVNPREIPDHDVFVGGIPCQAFSHSGSRKGFADERGVLFNAFARILMVKKPQAFLLENVKGMLTHDEGRTFPIIREALEDAGYSVDFRVMNSAEYGNIPQGRERIYVVGFRGDVQMGWPGPVERTTQPRDVLEASVPEKYFYDERYGKVYNLAKDFMTDDAIYQYRHMTGMRRNQSGLFPTLAAYMGTGGHNVPLILDGGRIRKVTPRECFNAMGYPASFVLPDIADGHLYKQAGNSVAVPVVKRIAEEIMRALLAGDAEMAA